MERLKWLCFFHLGADARVEIHEEAVWLRVRIEHSRVEPFEFNLPPDEAGRLSNDPAALEQFFLQQLTAHRR